MGELRDYFSGNTKRLIHKWDHYFDIYESHFQRFRGKEVVILEIGVYQGGSLQMWKHYFGEKALIYGLDINPNTKQFEEDNVKIFLGSQSDRKFLRGLKKEIPRIDILIDDGGHRMDEQIISFEELFDHVKPDGIYICEDILTSYNIYYGGGYKRKGTFIEYSKNLIDKLNAFHSEQKSLKADSFTSSVNSIQFYDSMIVIEKGPRETPFHSKTGNVVYQNEPPDNPGGMQLVKFKLLHVINSFLRYFRLASYKWGRGKSS